MIDIRKYIDKEKRLMQTLRMRIVRRYRLRDNMKEIKDLLNKTEREWRKRDEDRWMRRVQSRVGGSEERSQEVEEPRQDPNRDCLGEDVRGESVRVSDELVFKLINIQGLTEEKLRELEDMFFGEVKDKSVRHIILCLTETQQKMRRYRERPDLVTFTQQREMGDKRGGGLQVVMNKIPEIKFKKAKNENRDLLEIEGSYYGLGMRILLVYFDSNDDQRARDRNLVLRREIEERIESNSSKGLVVLGDMNGHLEILEDRREDINGKMIMDWVSMYELKLLNADERCSGRYTWARTMRGERENQRSAIDMVLVNREVYSRFRGMEIDEDREEVDLSDHSLITVRLKVNVRMGKKWKAGREIVGYKKGDSHLRVFAENVVRKWGENTLSIDKIGQDMREEADRTLKMRMRLRVCEVGGESFVEQKWMTREIRVEMKEKKRLNKELRYCVEEERERLHREWRAQKDKVKGMIREEREKFELEMTNVIKRSRDNGERLWEHVRELLGRKVEKEEEDEIYHEGVLMERREAGDSFMECWKEVLGDEFFNPEGVWSEEIKNELLREHEEIRERLFWGDERREIVPMNKPMLTGDELLDILRDSGVARLQDQQRLRMNGSERSLGREKGEKCW